MKLFDIVSNRPSEELRKASYHCPFCKGIDIEAKGTEQTLVGYVGEDYNHWWTSCRCKGCEETFIRESKGPYNVWYTKNGVVLEGMPSCFEGYQYKCIKCGGVVERGYTDFEGKPVNLLATKMVDGKLVKQYKTFYKCNECGHGGEIEADHYSGERPDKKGESDEDKGNSKSA